MGVQSEERSMLDRREFIGTAGVLIALPAASLIPAAPVAAAVTGSRLFGDWSVDDQWMGLPRYAEPIGCGRPAAAQPPAVEPVDAMFVEF